MLAEAARERLIDTARAAHERAYCPYSGFAVGAAVLTAGGSTFSGANVENAAYSATICGERAAIFQAVNAGQRSLVALAIYTPTDEPVAPCGACRQVLQEFGADAVVISACATAKRQTWPMAEVLPGAFTSDDLIP